MADKIRMDGKYVTKRDRYPVRIICVNRKPFPTNGGPVVGLVDRGEFEEITMFTSEGCSTLTSVFDLVEVREPEMVPLDKSDIVLGKTIVEDANGDRHLLVVAKEQSVDWWSYVQLREEVLKISFDNGATWQKPEKVKP